MLLPLPLLPESIVPGSPGRKADRGAPGFSLQSGQAWTRRTPAGDPRSQSWLMIRKASEVEESKVIGPAMCMHSRLGTAVGEIQTPGQCSQAMSAYVVETPTTFLCRGCAVLPDPGFALFLC